MPWQNGIIRQPPGTTKIMSNQPYIYEYRTYLKKYYGEVLHRVPLDVGFTCPHRRQDGSGGCTFCPEDGARAVQLGEITRLGEQISAGVSFARRRYGAKAFMAYLQAFTSTFGSTTHLRRLVSEILSGHDFRAISFGTRPDCLSPTSVSFLQELQQEIDVWVELGVQTMQDRTLRRINRGHDSKTSRNAILRLGQAGIKTAVHLIIGLPGEHIDDYRDTLSQLAPLPIDGFKIHNLHIIKNTRLAEEYAHRPFPLYDEHQYCEILLQLLPFIPADRPIIRLTTDTEENLLVAPRWHMDKGRFRKYLADQLRQRQIFQGAALSPPARPDSLPHVPVVTDDGSITFWNPEVKEHYHSPAGARGEALHKYVLPSALPARLRDRLPIRILDICFGLGYNSLVSLDLALGRQARLDIIGLEIDQRVVRAAAQQLQEKNTAFDWNGCLHQAATGNRWQKDNCSLQLLWGDARHTTRTLNGKFDLIWLDAFSTQRNSELWTVDFFRALYPLLHDHGAIYTYCAAIPVRSGFRNAGFFVGETEPFGRQRGGTVAARAPDIITLPLPERDLFLMTTSRGIPYRDPDGARSNKEILRARQEEILLFKTGP
jgi:radical SAM protein (TIGR01212 family)